MKKKLIIGVTASAIGLVAITGAAFAHGGDGTPGSSVRDRVAEIIGVAPEDLQSAVEQARGEQRDERHAAQLAGAVEAGVITQDEADAIQAWQDSKPGVLDEIKSAGKRGHFRVPMPTDTPSERYGAQLDRLVEAEKITEDEAQEIRDWLAGAPSDALAKMRAANGGDHRGQRRGLRGRMFGQGPGGRLFEGRFQIQPYVPHADEAPAASETLNFSVPGAEGEIV